MTEDRGSLTFFCVLVLMSSSSSSFSSSSEVCCFFIFSMFISRRSLVCGHTACTMCQRLLSQTLGLWAHIMHYVSAVVKSDFGSVGTQHTSCVSSCCLSQTLGLWAHIKCQRLLLKSDFGSVGTHHAPYVSGCCLEAQLRAPGNKPVRGKVL